MALGFALAIAADTTWVLAPSLRGSELFVTLVGVLFLAKQLLLAVGLVRLVPRDPNRSWADATLDGAIIAAGTAVGLWVFIGHALMHSGRFSDITIGTALSYVVVDLIVLAALGRLLFASGIRGRGAALLVSAVGLLLASDARYCITLAGTDPYRADTVSLLGWMVCAVLFGAAALHPSVHLAGQPGGAAFGGASAIRVAVFIVLAIVDPVISAAVEIISRRGPEVASLADDVIPALLVMVLSVLLVLRLGLLLRVVNNRAQALQQSLLRQEELRHQLTHRALHDPLTGLGNRSLLAERLDACVNAPTPRFALLLLDLDGFKDINDTLGHPAGDELLVEVARRLDEASRRAQPETVFGGGEHDQRGARRAQPETVFGGGEHDQRGARRAQPETVFGGGEHDQRGAEQGSVVRLGGDEFAILVPGATRRDAERLALAVLAAIREPYLLAGRQLYLTTSIGVLAGDGRRRAAGDALRDADLALYAAKAAGKNQVVIFEPALRKVRGERARLATGLRRALADDGLGLHFQPIIDLQTGGVHAVEALLRWSPPGRAPVSPGVFVPIAEETGLIVPIGGWVLDRALRQGREWYERYGVAMSVNVSALQLAAPDFADLVLDGLDRGDMPGEGLILELTESVLITQASGDDTGVQECLNRLRGRGVRIALDDFGTGYSSLSYLWQLPVDVLKIDRMFIGYLSVPEHVDSRRAAFLRAILEVGRSLELQTVAEGVETPEEARRLQEMGCRYVQGYLYAQPLPAVSMSEYLARPLRVHVA
jgi:predicted signal transduction protein with EAL and GGDEF domain